MATITSYGNRFLNNPTEYGNNYGIPTFSELTLFIGGATLQSGEIVTAARFYIELANGLKVYSPEIAYNGTGEVTYNFGKIQQNWIKPFGETNHYVAAGFEVKSNIQNGEVNGAPYYFWGWYGVGCFTLEYMLPEITIYNVYRVTPTTSIEHELETTISPLSTDPLLVNVMYYQFQKKIADVWTNIGSQETFSGSYNYLTYSDGGPYSDETSYQTRVVLSDKFNTIYAFDTLPTILVPLSIGKFGIGVGKVIENADAALDINGKVYRDNLYQPKIYNKKPSDPDPTDMETGDLLIIYNDTLDFTSINFPKEFGTGYVWALAGVWPVEYLFWASTSSSNNLVVKSIEASGWKADAPPTVMFDGAGSNAMIPYGSLPATVIMTFNGLVQFDSFTLSGWNQNHEPKNSPKSFAFFGSVDGHEWINLYYTTAFTDTYKTSATAAMNNSGLYFKYLKMVWISNQNDNNEADLTNATMIAISELKFVASGVKYV